MASAAIASRVLVVDDDEQGRDDLMEELRSYDIEPITVTGPYGMDIDRMLTEIEEQDPAFVICDHKLQPANLASFSGAEVVRRLVELKRPAMLLTMYQSTDRLELRRSRRAVPIIMGRDEFRADRVQDYYQVCRLEILDMPIASRKPHRVLIRVDDVPEDEKPQRLDAVIPSWSPDHAVPVPLTCVDPMILAQIQRGTYLLGNVNIGAETEDELFFADLDQIVSPPPDEVA